MTSVTQQAGQTQSRFVARYLRVSTDRQELARQDETTARLAAELFDGAPIRDFPEDGVSAFKKAIHERPEGSKLVAAIMAGDVLAVVADEQSRFERGRGTAWGLFVETCRANETRIVTVTDGEIEDSPEADLIGQVRAFTAHIESLHKQHRVRSKFEQMAKDGLWPAGPPPFGYKRGPKSNPVLIETPQLALVRRVCERYGEGESMTSLAEWLSEQLDRAISRMYVRDLVSNPAYRGLIRRTRDGEEFIYPGRHPRLLSDELARRIDARLARAAKERADRPSRVQPFSRVLVCECGAERRPIYHHTAKPGTPDVGWFDCRYGCKRKWISEYLELSVAIGLATMGAALHHRLDDPTWAIANPSSAEKQRLEGEIAELREEEQNLVALVRATGGAEAAADALTDLQARRQAQERLLSRMTTDADSYRAELIQLRDRIGDLDLPPERVGSGWLLGYLGAWAAASVEEKSRLLHSTVESIVAGDGLTLYFHVGLMLPIPILGKDRYNDLSRQLRRMGFGLTSAAAPS